MQYEIKIGVRTHQVVVHRADGAFNVLVDDRESVVDAVRIDAHLWSFIVRPGSTGAGGSYEVTVASQGQAGEIAVGVGPVPVMASLTGRRRRDRKEEQGHDGSGPQRLVAPMPGKIVRVLVKTGEAVRARQPVVVVEAMKMENELRAAAPGTVTEIHATEGQSVDAGALLAVIAGAAE
jgi:biotin carboxyl carrier protein